jgi:hypothetical protein
MPDLGVDDSPTSFPFGLPIQQQRVAAIRPFRVVISLLAVIF